MFQFKKLNWFCVVVVFNKSKNLRLICVFLSCSFAARGFFNVSRFDHLDEWLGRATRGDDGGGGGLLHHTG